MAFKSNYGQQRAERARSQVARCEEKLRQRQERSEERKAAAEADAARNAPDAATTPAEPRGDIGRKD